MSYYDEDKGYVGYDPYEAHDRRVHEEMYHKSKVPTVQELMDSKISRDYIEQSKKFIEEPVCEGDDFHDVYMYGFEKLMYDSFGDLGKSIELSAKDHFENKGLIRLWATSEEHIVRENTETFIVYRVDYPDEVIAVFFNKEKADKYVDMLNKKEEQLIDIKKTFQDYEDNVHDFFIKNESELSEEQKQQAHLELGIEWEK